MSARSAEPVLRRRVVEQTVKRFSLILDDTSWLVRSSREPIRFVEVSVHTTNPNPAHGSLSSHTAPPRWGRESPRSSAGRRRRGRSRSIGAARRCVLDFASRPGLERAPQSPGARCVRRRGSQASGRTPCRRRQFDVRLAVEVAEDLCRCEHPSIREGYEPVPIYRRGALFLYPVFVRRGRRTAAHGRYASRKSPAVPDRDSISKWVVNRAASLSALDSVACPKARCFPRRVIRQPTTEHRRFGGARRQAGRSSWFELRRMMTRFLLFRQAQDTRWGGIEFHPAPRPVCESTKCARSFLSHCRLRWSLANVAGCCD